MSWAHVQGGGTNSLSFGVTSLSATFVSAVTSGNLLVSGSATYLGGGSDTYTVTDNKANSWTRDTTLPGTLSVAVQGHTIAGSSVSGLAVTWTESPNPGFPAISIDEFSFTGTGAAESVISQSGTTGTAAPAVGSLTVTGTDLIYAVLGYFSNTTVTPALTAAFAAAYAAGQSMGINVQYKLNATTSVNPSWALGASETCFRCGVAFKGTAGGSRALFFPATLSLGAGGSFFQSGVNS